MSAFSGPVFRPGDAGYDTERAGFNRAVEHHPELIVGATDAADVESAIRLAAAEGLAVGIQATGHGVSVPADGALLITTHRMDGIVVDPRTRMATVQAGVPAGQAIAAAAAHGLAPLNGSNMFVSLVGYTLGGGLALLGRRYGFAADRVRALDVVGADGRLLRASEDSHPDLFWALRGGKGNFGVVVSMEAELVPLRRLYGGGLYFGGDAAAEVLHAWVDWTRTVPEDMSSSVMLARGPDGRYVVQVRIAYVGASAEGERLIAPLRALGPALDDTVREIPYAEVGSIHHEPDEPVSAFDKSLLLRELDPRAVDTLLSLAGPDADVSYIAELRHAGGAFARPPERRSAVGGRDAAYTMFSASIIEPGRLEDIRREHAALHRAMAPWSTGGAVLNFMGVDDVAVDRVRTAFTPEDFARLQHVKAAYDPDNLFRITHNIPPEGSSSSSPSARARARAGAGS
jgi:FAD/FMN-containing dehydrogenase